MPAASMAAGSWVRSWAKRWWVSEHSLVARYSNAPAAEQHSPSLLAASRRHLPASQQIPASEVEAAKLVLATAEALQQAAMATPVELVPWEWSVPQPREHSPVEERWESNPARDRCHRSPASQHLAQVLQELRAQRPAGLGWANPACRSACSQAERQRRPAEGGAQ